MFKLTKISQFSKGGETMKTLVLVLALAFVLGGACVADSITMDVYGGWNLIAAPLVPINPDPAAMFGAVPISGYLTRLDAATQNMQTYDEIDTSAFGNVLLGDGMWLYGFGSTTFTYTGVPDGVPDGAGVKTDMWISLPGNQLDTDNAGGWHLIGQPFNHDTPVSKTGVGDNIFFTDGTVLKTWAEAAVAGWVDGGMQFIDATTQNMLLCSYDLADDDTLRAGKGYQLRTYKDNLAMIIPAN